MAAYSRAEADAIFTETLLIIDPARAQWDDQEGSGGVVRLQSLQFLVHSRAHLLEDDRRDLLVSGKRNGDSSFVIQLVVPDTRQILARLCSASHHAMVHWHWYEAGVHGAGADANKVEHLTLDVRTDGQDRDLLLTIFCARLGIELPPVPGRLPV